MAADISVELPPVAQLKLVLMQGIANRVRTKYGTSLGSLVRAAETTGIDYYRLSRIMTGRQERFSLEGLVDIGHRLGMEITITAR